MTPVSGALTRREQVRRRSLPGARAAGPHASRRRRRGSPGIPVFGAIGRQGPRSQGSQIWCRFAAAAASIISRQRLAAVRLAPPARSVQVLAVAQQRQQPVPPQLVVVDQVLVAQAHPKHPLLDQPRQRVRDPRRTAVVLETLAQPLRHPRALLHLA